MRNRKKVQSEQVARQIVYASLSDEVTRAYKEEDRAFNDVYNGTGTAKEAGKVYSERKKKQGFLSYLLRGGQE